MKYDFDSVNNRRNTNSLKWDVLSDELPMWVADMDFKTAPCVINAINKKTETGIFGYSVIPEEWYNSIINWWKRRHDFKMEREWLIFCTGVIPAITCGVKRLTNTGDNVIVQTPVYDIFFHSIENHGRHVLENKLSYNEDGYLIDFKDLEEKLSDSLTTLMILCNPQNPGGRIWSREDLEKVGNLCKKYGVTVISDEIHCDITKPGTSYIPFAAVSDDCRDVSITCISATKAFNIAGLQAAAVSIPNERLRNIMERGLNSDEVAEPNIFACDATIAAFNEGEEWLDELRKYLFENKRFAVRMIKENISQLKVDDTPATYLVWADCSEITDDTEELCGFIRKETGLYISEGNKYRGNGNLFIRINVACPRSVLEKGMEKLEDGIKKYVQLKNKLQHQHITNGSTCY